MFKKFYVLIVLFLLFLFQTSAFAKNNDYRIVQDPKGVYIVEIMTSKAKNKLVPYVVDDLATNKEVYEKTGAKLVVNGGFFDMDNHKTVSFVTIDNKTVLSPDDNSAITNNKALKPYLDKIYNRSEFRVLEDAKGHLIYDIAPHNEQPKDGLVIKHALQGGPMLLPELRLEEEFYILVKDGKVITETASALHPHSRTALGIKDNNVYLFIVTKDAPMTMEQVADLTRKWGMEKALGLDGGGSTSFNSAELSVISEKNSDTGRPVKSFLILK